MLTCWSLLITSQLLSLKGSIALSVCANIDLATAKYYNLRDQSEPCEIDLQHYYCCYDCYFLVEAR